MLVRYKNKWGVEKEFELTRADARKLYQRFTVEGAETGVGCVLCKVYRYTDKCPFSAQKGAPFGPRCLTGCLKNLPGLQDATNVMNTLYSLHRNGSGNWGGVRADPSQLSKKLAKFRRRLRAAFDRADKSWRVGVLKTK